RAERERVLALHVAHEHPEVDPGGEDRTLAVEDDCADVRRALGGTDRVGQVEEQLTMEGVPLLGSVDADEEDRTVAATRDEVRHGRRLCAPCTGRRNRFTRPDAVAIRRRSMRPIPIALALLLAATRLHADTILYANQATTNGIDGFCIRGDGS